MQIYRASHPLKAAERIIDEGIQTRYLTNSRPVIIGYTVWIGGDSVIFPGARIGNNVAIGTGSIATKSIPDNVLAFEDSFKIRRKL